VAACAEIGRRLQKETDRWFVWGLNVPQTNAAIVTYPNGLVLLKGRKIKHVWVHI
jgi:hypothetical protein